MKSNLFRNFSSNDAKNNIRSKSITSLKALKLKQVKPNPNLNSIINLSRIYAQEQPVHNKNTIKSISPSSNTAVDISSAGKLCTVKTSKPVFHVSAKNENTTKKHIPVKSSPINSSRSKFSIFYNKAAFKEKSMSKGKTSKIEKSLNSDRINETKVLTLDVLNQHKKNPSVNSNESFVNSSFKSKVKDLFEKFKNSHTEIIKSFK